MATKELIHTPDSASEQLAHLEEHAECVATLEQQLTQMESLTNELKRILVKFEDTLEEEGIRQQVETLERWAESYRRGLAAANKMSSVGPAWLSELRDRMVLAATELQRLEDEGGAPLTGEQIAKTEELLRVSRKIDRVIPTIAGMAVPMSDEAQHQTH